MKHPASLRTLKLTLAYDGSAFHGWQVQPGKPTIQGTLAEAIESLTGEKLLPQGSGRTDAGVHALAQIATFQTASSIPAANIRVVLNDRLPSAIRVLAVEEAAADFHARHSARAKRYHYRIWRGDVVPPFLARYVTHHPYPLDESAMQQAAALVTGEHDFTSFAAADPDRTQRLAQANDPAAMERGVMDSDVLVRGVLERGVILNEVKDPCEAQIADVAAKFSNAISLHSAALRHISNVRSIHESRFERHDEELLYIVRGNGFLHHMVRNLVGTFLLVGKGTIAPAEILAILQARDRRAAGATAPPEGLYLVEVEY